MQLNILLFLMWTIKNLILGNRRTCGVSGSSFISGEVSS